MADETSKPNELRDVPFAVGGIEIPFGSRSRTRPSQQPNKHLEKSEDENECIEAKMKIRVVITTITVQVALAKTAC